MGNLDFIKRQELMRRIVTVVATVLLLVGMGSCGKRDTSRQEVPMVEVAEVRGQNEMDATTFSGRTKSASEVNLAFRVSGPISQVLVKEGDHVSKGQVVAILDSRDYEVQLAATQAEYAQVKADAERVMALYAEGNTTASNNDKARYGLQQITQKLANHKNQLADTRLRSTIDGYVQTKLHEAGETVAAGMPVLSVFGSGDTEVEIHVSSADFARLEQFVGFSCKFDVTGDTAYPLAIARTSQEANSSQLYTVRLRFTGAFDHKRITPGMTTMVYAEVADSETDGRVLVPSSALLRSDGKTQVFVYDSSTSVVKARTVTVSSILRDGTASVAGGLKSGERVVASGVHHVRDGQQVRLLQKPTSSNVGGLL